MNPVYRLTVFEKRSVDPAESAALTPIAGAPHADPFQVASARGVAGFQPYLDAIRGRRGRIDPLTRKTDTGQLVVRLLDKRTQDDNLHRWVTAFLGNENGAARLIGRLVRVEEDADDGAGFQPFFTGRVQDLRLGGKLWYELILRDTAEELGRDLFTGRPASSAAYAFPPGVLPNDLTHDFGGIAGAQAPLAVAMSLSVPEMSTTYRTGKLRFVSTAFGGDGAIPDDWERLRVTTAVDSLATDLGQASTFAPGLLVGVYSRSGRVRVTREDTGATGEFWLGEVDDVLHRRANWFEYREHPSEKKWYVHAVGIRELDPSDADYMVLPEAGAMVRVEVIAREPASARSPIFIDDVHPVQLWQDLLDGKLGRLKGDGAPSWSIPYDSARFAELIADETFPRARFIIDEPWKLNAFVEEQICLPFGLAYRLDEDGEVYPIDMRMPSAVPAVPTIVDADLVAGESPGWSHERSSAITQFEVTYYSDRAITAEELTANAEERPSVPAGMIQSLDHPYIPFDGEGIADYGENGLRIDARGLRATVAVDAKGGEIGADGQERLEKIQRQAAQLVADLSGPFGRGAMTAQLVCRRRASTNDCYPGDWRIVDVDVLPDPASNLRGGNRLMRCIERREEGPRIHLTFFDAGPGTVALSPSLGSVTLITSLNRPALEVPVTLNAAGQAAVVQFACTDPSVAVRPAETSELWTFGARLTSSGTAGITDLPDGKRIWVRGRTVPQEASAPQLPSGWVFPSGAGYVDAAAKPLLLRAAVAIDPDTGAATVSWDIKASTAGARITHGLHLLEAEPVLGSAMDVDASLSEHELTGVTVLPGQAITVQVEPWSGWDGNAVTGTAGEPLQETGIRGPTEEQATLTLLDFDTLQRTDATAESLWESGAGLTYIWVFTRLARQPLAEGSDPKPQPTDAPDEILDASQERYLHQVPPPGYILFRYFVGVGVDADGDLVFGPMEVAIVNPTNEAPDTLTTLQALVNDEDGSVSVRAEAVVRTRSYRYAYKVGADPAWPTDAEVEAGKVRTINGSDGLTLPAGTVPYNQMIRLRAAPYTGPNGTGADGASDHGEVRGAEDVRLKPPVSLEPGEPVESGGTGAFPVTVRDPGGYATGLYQDTKAGEAPWTGPVLITASPVDGAAYSANVALIEGHQSQIKFRLEYEFHGARGFVEVSAPGMDRGAIPNITLVPKVHEGTGAISASVIGDSDTASVKIAASTSAHPSEATVRAAPAIAGRMLTPLQVGTLLTAQLGQTIYFSAFGYGPNGEESTALAKAEVIFQPIAPTLEPTTEEEDQVAGKGTFGVTVHDQSGQADRLWKRSKVGAGDWSARTPVTSAPANNTEYSETINTQEGHQSFVLFELEYTLGGETHFVPAVSGGFDRGRIPDPSLVTAVAEDGDVEATIQGDFDQASARVKAWEQSAWDALGVDEAARKTAAAAAVRLASAIDGRTITSPMIEAVLGAALLTLTPGQSAVVACLGYSQAGGAGLESSELVTAPAVFASGPVVDARITATMSTQVTIRATSYSGTTETGEVEWRLENGAWSSDWDADASAESDETKTVSRPTGTATTYWFRAKVGSAYSQPVPIVVPAQAVTQLVNVTRVEVSVSSAGACGGALYTHQIDFTLSDQNVAGYTLELDLSEDGDEWQTVSTGITAADGFETYGRSDMEQDSGFGTIVQFQYRVRAVLSGTTKGSAVSNTLIDSISLCP